MYIEFGNKGPAEHSVTFGKSMWGAMINQVGGNNISAPFVEFYSPVNPEKVLAAKPDVIIITGRETELKKNPSAMVMGWGISKAEAEQRLAGLPNAGLGKPACGEKQPSLRRIPCQFAHALRRRVGAVCRQSGLPRAV